MKRLVVILTIIFTLATYAGATSYFMSPTGNDSNNGLSSGSPWLSPNHSVNCGDTITAATGAYTVANSFTFGSFGTVTGTGHCVAWVICAQFPNCTATAGPSDGPAMWITSSHWGVSGFVLTNVEDDYGCVQQTGTIHDIVVVNTIFNGCHGGGMNTGGQDYFVYISDIAYDAAQESSHCASGFQFDFPTNSDTAPGTHIYGSQLFSWHNFDPNPCNATAPTDGQGIILDSWDINTYTGQGAFENNVTFLNGAGGIRIDATTLAKLYIKNNTTYGNNGTTASSVSECGEIASQGSENLEVYLNLLVTNSATGCAGVTNYVFFVQTPFLATIFYNNFGYSSAGNNTGQSGGFTFGPNNTFGTNPQLANPPLTNPGAPNCGAFVSVPACMAGIISQFVPQAMGTDGYGYQPVSINASNDSLFPQWLCQYGNQLSGLVTMGCLKQVPASPHGLTLMAIQ